MNTTWLKINADGSTPDQPSRPLSEKRRNRAENKRREILDVAQEQFLKNGYAGTSIDSLVDILGGSKSTIYRYFNNKEALFTAIIQDFGHRPDQEDFPILDGNIYNELFAFAKDRMRRVFSPLNINIMRIVIAEAARQPQIAELYFQNAPKPTYAVFRSYLEQAVARGDLAIDNLDDAVEEFLGGLLLKGLLGRLFEMETNPSEDQINAKAERLTKSFLANYGAT